MPATPRFARPLATVLLPLALLLTACGGDSGTSNDAAGTPTEGPSGDAAPKCEGEKVSVGITSSSSDLPFFIAQEEGYFEDAGLEVEFTKFPSAGPMVAPLGAGQLDVGAGAPSAGFYNAVARGVELRIVADKASQPENYGYAPIMVRKDLIDSGQVKTAADLKGMRFAEPAPAVGTAPQVAAYLATGDLDYDDVEHVYLAFPQHAPAFANKAIDASIVTEPGATVAEEHAVRVWSAGDAFEQHQTALVIYSEDFAGRGAAPQCLMTAYLKGARDFMSAYVDGELTGPNADRITEIATTATDISPELFRQITPNYVDPDGKLNIESMQNDLDFFKERGLLEGTPPELDDLIDLSFAEKAAADLGPHTPPN